MRKRGTLGALALVILAIGAQAADPDEELRKQHELARQRATAEVEQQWKGLPPAEIEKRRKLELLMQSSYQHIDGKRTPELVPYQIRMQHFFDRYDSGTFERMLAPALSAQDQAILATFSKSHTAELKKHEAAFDAEWMAIGARASSMSAQEIAGALKAATLRSESALAAVYRNAINSLSPGGRQRVLDFAFTHVRPQVTIEDPFLVANGDPEFFKDQVVKTYEMRRAGQVPEPPAGGNKASTPSAGKSSATTDTVTGNSQMGSTTPIP
jgi:hypothetical protein